jgi:glycosyltransferase involved in cell wall biosynthesis
MSRGPGGQAIEFKLLAAPERMADLERVVEACEGLDVSLRILGRLTREQHSLLRERGLEFESFENLSRAEVVTLYQECDLVLFSSLYEGFGMPILEGQAVGRPVLTSDRSPMREVAGGGALLVDPEDVNSIRDGLEKLLRDPELREELVERGFENVKHYTAEAVASQYADLYREVVQGRR